MRVAPRQDLQAWEHLGLGGVWLLYAGPEGHTCSISGGEPLPEGHMSRISEGEALHDEDVIDDPCSLDHDKHDSQTSAGLQVFLIEQELACDEK